MDSKKKIHYGYFIVVACCACIIPVSLALSCTGLLFTSIAQSFEVGPGFISNYMTALWIVSAVTLPISGRLFEKVNAKIMDTIAVLCIGVGLIWNSFAVAPWMIFVGGGVCGYGVSILMYLNAPVMINRWFKKRAGLFIGIVMSFTGIGSVILSPIIGGLLVSMGWHTTFRIMGIIALVIGLPFSIFVICDYPANKGIIAYGDNEETANENAGSKDEVLPGIEASKAFKSPIFIILVLFTFCLALALYTQSMNPNYIKSLPISATKVTLFSTIASFLMAAQVLAKIVLGTTSEKAPIITGVIALAIGICGFAGNLLFPGSMVGLIAAGCCIGVYTAILNVLCPILTRRFFGLREYSKIYSVLATVMSIGGVLQAPILGTVLDNSSWVVLETCFIILLALAILFLLIMGAAGKKSAANAAVTDNAQTAQPHSSI